MTRLSRFDYLSAGRAIGHVGTMDKIVRSAVGVFFVLAILSGHPYSIPWVDVLSLAVMYIGFTVITAFDPIYALGQFAARAVAARSHPHHQM